MVRAQVDGREEATARAQADGREETTARAQADTRGEATWTPLRTPWGDPDLQGMWPIDELNGTPVQRPREFGNRRFLTDAEFAERTSRLAALDKRYDEENASDRIGVGHWAETGAPNRLTSLIVEPASGRLPPMTAEGERRSASMTSTWDEDVDFDGSEDFNSLERCITRGLPASMFPFMYNSGIEILQSPGYVVIRLELIHETRIVPLDGRPPLAPAVRTWLGDSRGHWEGSTLVVETTNFTGETPMLIVGPGSKPIPTSRSLHITERFARRAEDTIDYEIRVEDPEILTAPWTAAFPLKRNAEYRIYEYACHEGNEVVRNMMTITKLKRR
jgi:hypothetical protein